MPNECSQTISMASNNCGSHTEHTYIHIYICTYTYLSYATTIEYSAQLGTNMNQQYTTYINIYTYTYIYLYLWYTYTYASHIFMANSSHKSEPTGL